MAGHSPLWYQLRGSDGTPPVTQLRASPARGLAGAVAVPGDKSISHRALILGALAAGETRVHGLLESEDVHCTAAALRALGAGIERRGEAWVVHGRGIGGLAAPAAVLDLGNSGTGVRLLMGVAAAHPFTSVFTGDASLCARPMGRVAEPLRRMGATIDAREGSRMPLSVTGGDPLLPIEYALPVPSAQVKSAVLLAGLGVPGTTTVIEPAPTRDHTERLLARFGAEVRTSAAGGGRSVAITGEPELVPCAVSVPGDPSSAAFLAVAAAIVPGSDVRIAGVGWNPLRTGLFDCLGEMGADLTVEDLREVDGEPVADLRVRYAPLAAIDVPPERAPAMIDEYPIFAVAAACAAGTTRMGGLAELRVKESDRLAAIAAGLAACGIAAESGADSLSVEGAGGPPPGGGVIEAPWDHRIAMAFLILGLGARAPVTVAGTESIATSFPGFAGLLAGLGGDVA